MVDALFSLAWLTAPLQPLAEPVSLTHYRELIDAYRNGSEADTVTALKAVDHVLISERNEQLLAVTDVARAGERREVIAATILMADLAVSSPTGARDFFLDEAIELAAALGEEQGIGLQKRIHIAVTLTLFRDQRIADAYQVIEPAARRFPADIDVQYTFGTVSELRGLVEGSDAHMARAQAAYQRVLISDADHTRARARLGHVLVRLGELETARQQLTYSLETLDDDVHRVIALISLGDTHARSSEPERALEAYQDALALDPSCQAAIVSLSRVFARTGQSRLGDESIYEMLTRAAQWDAADSWMLYRLADSLSAQERWKDLRRWFR